MEAAKKIIAYLSGTIDRGHVFEKREGAPILGQTDADYGDDLDTRCSTSGFVYFRAREPHLLEQQTLKMRISIHYGS